MKRALLLLCMALAAGAQGAPLLPTSDAEVVETLAAQAGDRAEERALRRRQRANPGDATVAVALARRYLEQAHREGDPRFAGRALAALQHWAQASNAPAEVLLPVPP